MVKTIYTPNIKQHGTYNDPNVQLAQFEQSKYYVLDFQRLDRLLSKDKLDMGVRLGYTNSRDGTKWSRIDFVNIVDGKMFYVLEVSTVLQSYKLNRKRIPF